MQNWNTEYMDWTESSDETFTENEALKLKPPKKKLKLSVPKDKEIDGNLWTMHLVNSLYLKYHNKHQMPGPCRTLLVTPKTQYSNPHFKLLCLVQVRTSVTSCSV